MATAEERLATLESEVRSANSKLDRIETALIGNGAPGLMVRVDRLEHGRKAWLVIATPTAVAIIGVCLRAIIWGF